MTPKPDRPLVKKHNRKKTTPSKEKEPKTNKQVRQQSAAPVTTLPYDILSEIFKKLYIEHDLLPTRLGSVCTFWRRVAWATPQLWTELELNNRFWWSKDRDYILNLYLRNVGGLSIDLVISDYPSDLTMGRRGKKWKGKRSAKQDVMIQHPDPFTGATMSFPAHDIFSTIFVHHPEKLMSVMLNQYVYSWLQEIEILSDSGGFINLETFAITSDEGDFPVRSFPNFPFLSSNNANHDSHPVIAVQNVPKLRSVFLMGPRNRFIFPWSQLSFIHLHDIDATYAMEILLECENLEELKVFQFNDPFMDDIDDITFPSQRVVLHQLKSFQYSDFTMPHSWEIGLSVYLAFPALKELILDASPLSFDLHNDFLRSIPSTLVDLTVVCDETPTCTENYLELFTRLDLLSSLSVTFYESFPVQLLRGLTAKQQSQTLLPSLKHLSLTINIPSTSFGKRRFNAILGLVRSRHGVRRPNGVEEISHFDIQFNDDWFDMPQHFKSGINQLMEEGMVVHIKALSGDDSASWLWDTDYGPSGWD